MKISIVTTMYNSAPYLEEFHRRSVDSVLKLTTDYEIIFVNDGSPDDSLEVALMLIEQDENIKVVDLSRNFGHHKAIVAGLAEVKGELVFLIDCDLEEKPEWIELFFKAQQQSIGIDVVYGIQIKRKGSAYERLSGYIFYAILNALSDIKMPNQPTTARLMSRRYVDALLKYGEREYFAAGIFHLTGYLQVPFPVNKMSFSKTTYSFKKKLSMALNSVLSFSNKPLRMVFNFGFVITVSSAIYIVYLLYRQFFFGGSLVGWTSVIVSVWFLGGCILLSMGLIGLYLAKVFSEVKQRPMYQVRQVIERSNKNNCNHN